MVFEALVAGGAVASPPTSVEPGSDVSAAATASSVGSACSVLARAPVVQAVLTLYPLSAPRALPVRTARAADERAALSSKDHQRVIVRAPASFRCSSCYLERGACGRRGRALSAWPPRPSLHVDSNPGPKGTPSVGPAPMGPQATTPGAARSTRRLRRRLRERRSARRSVAPRARDASMALCCLARLGPGASAGRGSGMRACVVTGVKRNRSI